MGSGRNDSEANANIGNWASIVTARGPRLLRRNDNGSWAEVLAPLLRDTATLPAAVDINASLAELDQLIGILLRDVTRFSFPDRIVHTPADDPRPLDVVEFCSCLVGHRAERLVQLTELAAGALDNLEHRSVQLAAIAGRSMFEIAAESAFVDSRLLQAWHGVHGETAAIRTLVEDRQSELWRIISRSRLQTRNDDNGSDLPTATSSATRLEQLAKIDESFAENVKRIYSWLCDATHPNVEAQAVMWRPAGMDSSGRQYVEFSPTAGTSPVELAVIDAVIISLKAVLPYCRDLWWVAAEAACTLGLAANEENRLYGVPLPQGRNDQCCCGSGLKFKLCDHPEPTLPSKEISDSD